MAGLTENQRRFCIEYAASRNAVRSYRAAFPKSTYFAAAVAASRLLKRLTIQNEVKAARKAHAKGIATDARKTLDELAALAHSDPDDVFDEGPSGEPVLKKWKSITPAGRKSIKKVKVRSRLLKGQGDDGDRVLEVETELVFHSKDPSLDKLAKYFGIINEGCAYWQWQEKFGEWVKAANEANAAGKELPPPPAMDSRVVFQPKPGGFKTQPMGYPGPIPDPVPTPAPTDSPSEQTGPFPFCVMFFTTGMYELCDSATGGLRFPTREAACAERDRLNAEVKAGLRAAPVSTPTKPAWPNRDRHGT